LKLDYVAWGQDVLEQEAQAIIRAKDNLGSDFELAATTLMKCSGKVVVSGMGKSGHIGKKLAATFSSTGTPSFYLHPSEALHGDLGMLNNHDLLLLIAYSGETAEVLEVAKFGRRHDIPIISICGNQNSTLAKFSDIFLDGGVGGEADGLDLAPTTSSTLALAIGDALAVTMMKARGFTEADFARYHPGGKLGKRLSLVENYMRPLELQDLIQLSWGFHDVLETVTRHNFGIAAVVSSGGELVGAISDGDIRRLLLSREGQALSSIASEFMSKKPKTIDAKRLAIDAVKEMNDNSITNLFVTDAHDRPLGILRMHDLIANKVI